MNRCLNLCRFRRRRDRYRDNMKEYQLYAINTRSCNFSNYCYIVKDTVTSSAIIIDPAWEMDKVENILQNTDSVLKGIFLSHSHFDHVNLVNSLLYRHNCKVYMSGEEIRQYNFKCLNLCEVNNNEEISIDNIKVKCILTPGHTKGSMCYHIFDSLFTGDTVFIEGCGICDFSGGSAADMYYSLRYLKDNISPDTGIYPGHSYGEDPGMSFGKVIKNNIYFQINDIEQFVGFRLRNGQKNLFDFR